MTTFCRIGNGYKNKFGDRLTRMVEGSIGKTTKSGKHIGLLENGLKTTTLGKGE